jgi:hypothetical protein
MAPFSPLSPSLSASTPSLVTRRAADTSASGLTVLRRRPLTLGRDLRGWLSVVDLDRALVVRDVSVVLRPSRQVVHVLQPQVRPVALLLHTQPHVRHLTSAGTPTTLWQRRYCSQMGLTKPKESCTGASNKKWTPLLTSLIHESTSCRLAADSCAVRGEGTRRKI